RQLTLVGITGTNGKTTTSYLVEALLQAWGLATGVIGTIQYVLGNETRPASQTTPEALDLQSMLAHMRDGGVRGVAMEVSSHALSLARADGLAFDVAVFTNLTQDHLAAHRRAQRDEPARGGGDRARARPRATRHRPGPRGSRHRAGTLRAGAGWPAVPGGRRLRPHPRCARARPDDRAQAHARPARRRLRLRRRPRPRQATDHGGDRRAPRRPRVGDLRQPALGAAGGDNRRGGGRRAPDRG